MKQFRNLFHPIRLAIFTGLIWLCLSLPRTALALDPGFASGVLTINSERISLKHAYAWKHDGKELGNRGWRFLLTDREVPIDLLAGPLALLPSRWAESGRLKGVLIRNDLRKLPHRWKVQALLPQSIKSAMLNKLPFRLGTQSLRISGDINLGDTKYSQTFSVQAHFDAPVFHDEPVSSDLKGKQARNSPAVTALCAFNEAWRHTDWQKLATLSTAEKYAEMQPLIQSHSQELAAASTEQKAQLAAAMLAVVDDTAKTRADVLRVVIRGKRAIVLRKKLGPQAMLLEDGIWKVDF